MLFVVATLLGCEVDRQKQIESASALRLELIVVNSAHSQIKRSQKRDASWKIADGPGTQRPQYSTFGFQKFCICPAPPK